MIYVLACSLALVIGALITVIYYINNVYMPLLKKVNEEVAYLVRDINGIDKRLKDSTATRDDIYLKLSKLSNEVTTWKRKN